MARDGATRASAEREHPASAALRLASRSARLPLEALRFLGTAQRRRHVRPPAGAPPGELAVPDHAYATQIRVLAWDETDLEEREAAAEEISPPDPTRGRVTWIDVEGFADRAALERLGQAFGIHPLALADVVHVPQRPKAELYGERLLVVTQMARLAEGGEVAVEQVGLVIGPGWLVTFQEGPGDVFDPLRARIRTGGTRIRSQGVDFLAYSIVDAVVDGYFPVVEALGAVLEDLEEEVLLAPSPAVLARIHATRRTLLHLHRVQWRQRDAIGTLLRDESLPFSPPVRPYLRDVHDHAFQSLDAIESYRDLAVSLMDVYLSTTSNRLNEVMKLLTVMASVFIPLTFVTGVYGMNFDRMPELHWRYGYPAVWGVMVVLAVGLLVWFRRRGWLRSLS
jgi:magnesium transporter